jgi:predicted flap endonuclease-1-like 5' DNA nuclease
MGLPHALYCIGNAVFPTLAYYKGDFAVQVRQKLNEFEGSMASAIGGGLALMMIAWLLSSASGAGASNAGQINVMFVVGLLLLVGGTVLWFFGSRPQTVHDDWSVPLYTGHDHAHAHAEPHHDEPAHDAGAHHDSHADHAGHDAHTDHAAPPAAAAVAHYAAAEPLATPPVMAAPAQPVAEPPAMMAAAPVAPMAAVEAAPPAPPVSVPAEPTTPDDLTAVEGIGPKIAGALINAGITTFTRLAMLQPEEIERIVKDANVRMVGKADTFPKQAKLLSEGKMDEFQAYIDTLTNGQQEP